jgi:hypothetical protein
MNWPAFFKDVIRLIAFILALFLLTHLLGVKAPAAEVGTQQYMDDLTRFHTAYSPFMRGMLGCPPDATQVEQCNPKLARIDHKRLEELRELAPLVFPVQKRERKYWWQRIFR